MASEIEEKFLQELYNLKLEDLQDLEKIATSKETENIDIPDNILKIFIETNASLDQKTDVELTKILISMNKKDEQRDAEEDNKSTSSEEDDNTTTSSSAEEIEEESGSSDDDDGSIKSHNNSDEEEEEEDEKNTIDIEEQIKNSALEALRYNIELEKERQYARQYPRKKVGIKNTGVSCYANAAIQMLYSLPFYRKYYTEITTNNDEHLNVIKNLFILMNNASDNTPIDTKKSKCNLTQDLEGQQDSSEYLTWYIPYIINVVNEYEEKKQYKCLNGNDWIDATNIINYFVNIKIKPESKNINDCLNDFMHEKYDANYPTSDTCKDAIGNSEIEEEKISIIPSKENRYFFIMLNRRNINNEKNIQSIEPNKTLLINNIEYTLSGVVLHTDETSVEAGHYIYYQCDENGEYTKKYNDGIVSVFNVDETDSINKNATIFAYTRYPVEENNPVDPLPPNVFISITDKP